MIWSAIRLRPIHTPTTTPSTTIDRGHQRRGQRVHGVLPEPDRDDQAQADRGPDGARSAPDDAARSPRRATKVSQNGRVVQQRLQRVEPVQGHGVPDASWSPRTGALHPVGHARCRSR